MGRQWVHRRHYRLLRHGLGQQDDVCLAYVRLLGCARVSISGRAKMLKRPDSTARVDGLATGILSLNMSCATTEDGNEMCALVPSDSMGFTTKGGQTPQEPGSGCPGSVSSYQSWQLEQWQRQYELPPGSSSSDPPKTDTGPRFVLRNMRNRGADSFTCTTSGQVEDDSFTGTCAAADQASASTAEFVFDRKLDMLTVTQHWQCNEV